MNTKPLVMIVFEKYDTDKSGFITHNELRNMCYDLGHYLTDGEMAMAIHKLDLNGDRKISFEEFRNWWRLIDRFSIFSLSESQTKLLSNAIEYFRYFDRNNNGSIDHQEFKSLHNDLIKNGYSNYLTNENDDFKKLDTNKNGTICFNEYIGWLVDIGIINNK